MILLSLVVISLVIWRLTTGTIDIASVRTARSEIFYWVTIMFSQTLGTALGDYVASEDGLGLGYLVSGAVFGGMMLILVGLYYRTSVSRTILFWIAFILTRPLGAVTGDFLDKPIDDGGLGVNRYILTAVLLAAIVLAILSSRKGPRRKLTDTHSPSARSPALPPHCCSPGGSQARSSKARRWPSTRPSETAFMNTRRRS